MTSPTREEIIDANNALAALVCVALNNTADPNEKDWIRTIARELTAALPPLPRPTMADVEWDDDLHCLAEAEHVDWGKVVMLTPAENTCTIRCALQNDEGISIVLFTSSYLTPTGKRYTLTEVQDD